MFNFLNQAKKEFYIFLIKNSTIYLKIRKSSIRSIKPYLKNRCFAVGDGFLVAEFKQPKMKALKLLF
jgi:hypothetical protein